MDDPLAAKRAEILTRQADEAPDWDEAECYVRAHLVALGLRKATKRELREILIDVMANGL